MESNDADDEDGELWNLKCKDDIKWYVQTRTRIVKKWLNSYVYQCI
jgi:hypothetical protein